MSMATTLQCIARTQYILTYFCWEEREIVLTKLKAIEQLTEIREKRGKTKNLGIGGTNKIYFHPRRAHVDLK